VPRIFRRPVVCVNLIPLGVNHLHAFTGNPYTLFVPKKLWLRREKRFLTFRDIIDLGADEFFHSEQYENAGIDVMENTSDEIAAVTVEMDERLKGTWQECENDKDLQKQFWAILVNDKAEHKLRMRIGADFLRKNKELLK